MFQEAKASEHDTNPSKRETDTDINLLWKKGPTGQSTGLCIFERPDGKLFFPREGVLLENYSSYGRGAYFGECGISIAKPLNSEDIGMWRIMSLGTDTWPRRCQFLHVGDMSQSGMCYMT